MTRTTITFAIILAGCCALRSASVHAGRAGRAAPEFVHGLDWLNVERPLKLSGLRGKVVLLDFWTYCCINCIQVLPDLKRLEARHGDALVVIGVHSAKFKDEGVTENIRQAILRYDIRHPVVNDRGFKIWRQHQVNSWPTLVLIDPAGREVARRAGENAFEFFDGRIAALARGFEAKGLLDRRPLKMRLERKEARKTRLSFPSKITAIPSLDRLVVSDSNHNQILVLDPTGKVLFVIGSGKSGDADGPFEKASFNRPHGVAFASGRIYVADTENHLIRIADLTRRTVGTLAGTGLKARESGRAGPARQIALASPWDLEVVGRRIYVAMAGLHQIWVLDLGTATLAPFAGSGWEDIVDGPRRRARLAQPSGISIGNGALYFADSESSSVRLVELGKGGRVVTVAGPEGLGLFQYGDRDGVFDDVRFQHPLGVHFADGVVYVADTYNDKIKVVYPGTKRCVTLFGGKKVLDEPNDVTRLGDKLYVTDTNSHRIVVYDLKTKQLSELVLGRPQGGLPR